MQTENLELAEKSLAINKRDLELMKDYATTTEVRASQPSCCRFPAAKISAMSENPTDTANVQVSIARIYNHDVAKRKHGEKVISAS